jgi:hypothetical protein
LEPREQHREQPPGTAIASTFSLSSPFLSLVGNFALHLPVSVEAPALNFMNLLGIEPLSVHLWLAVMLIRMVGCITGIPVMGPGSNNTHPGKQPIPS